MSETLAPCPWCKDTFALNVVNFSNRQAVLCDRCGCRGPIEYGKDVAVANWNRRAESADHAALTKRVADLEETLAFAAQYKGIEARACPLCHYENGVFVDRCQMHKDMDALTKQVAELEAALAAANAEIAERDASFDLRWSADMEAIKQWQEATGRKLVWPGHGDLCVWLMAQLAEAKRWEPNPDWSTAPVWAQWWAVDANEWAAWFSGEPKLDDEHPEWHTFSQCRNAGCCELPVGIDWRTTLRQRPSVAGEGTNGN